MSLASQVSTLATRIGTEFKTVRSEFAAVTGSLGSLTTTNKTSLVNAINEVKAGSAGAPPDASATVKGIVELATDAETLTGTDTTRATTPANIAAALATVTIADASTTVKGKVELATNAETTTGTDTALATTPAGVKAAIDARTGTETAAGILELATNAETVTGTDTVRATHPAGTKAAIDARIDNGALGTSTTNAPSSNAVKIYADALIAANDAMVFKGVIDASANPNYPASNRGDTYRISVAGKIGGASGTNVEVGDLLIALTDGTAAGTQAAVGAQWNITQSNIDGAVTGPTSSVASNLPSFSGTTGKVIADSGFAPSNAAIGAGSATVLPTSSAVKTYVDTGVGTAALKANNLSDLANVATARTNLGLGTAATTASTAYDAAGAATAAQAAAIAASQPLDADLTAIAALTSAADKVPYSTGTNTWALANFTSAGRTLVGAADAAAQRTALSVYSQTEVGDPTTDFVATFNAALI